MTAKSVDQLVAGLKQLGNDNFKQQKFQEAIYNYSQALEASDSSEFMEALLTNRAAAAMKLELYGTVLQDCTRALDLNPQSYKAFYRRALAHTSLFHFKEAASDFKSLVAIKPNDAKARKLYDQALKEHKKRLFEAAIRIQPKSFFALYDLSISGAGPVEVPELELTPTDPITPEYIRRLIAFCKQDKEIPHRNILQILKRGFEILNAEPNLVEFSISKAELQAAGDNRVLTVFGDVHGQFFDLVHLIETVGMPSDTHRMVFMGDYVDRGAWGVPCFVLIVALKVMCPNSVTMLRGNHETKDMNSMFGLNAEIVQRYTAKLSEALDDIFNRLPLAAVADIEGVDRTMFVHGGLPDPKTRLPEINLLHRNQQPPSSGIFTDLLWSDPTLAPGRTPSPRGTSFQFGPDVADEFMTLNNLTQVVRAHQVVDDGYKVEFPKGPKVATVFSAARYCDFNTNKGAVGFYTGRSTELEFMQYEAQPHPDRPLPMLNNQLSALFNPRA
ncbi:Serine/threonine protein phosphatase 5 [Carpediemonas membranifera]|uniref:Serine/threonine-protein phosphatase n=1 Tax=Carpediemonas membranifera TaxID=201153 RepID=A0A8J6B976_9EUKA|nr:Serine/threonine protein phosphatase 5 [Carpediemonas membranifera]|eukprot:KAG9392607.1 Serine/threonine protein phosphatase 5 [Carpediemonas membranifera]